MLEFIAAGLTYRKAALFGCACCRRLWGCVRDERWRGLVELRERDADGNSSAEELKAAFQALWTWPGTQATGPFGNLINPGFTTILPHLARMARWGVGFVASMELKGKTSRSQQEAAKRDAKQKEEVAQCDILRDLVGNPFRLVTADPCWWSADVVALAKRIYADRTFHWLPILADAMLDGGCDSADIIDHCRSTQPHVRGCWVLDLVLGKQ